MGQSTQKIIALNEPSTLSYVVQHLKEVFFFVCLVLAIYFFIALLSYHSTDPAWTHTGHNATQILNWGGLSGAWFADVSLSLLGYFAYLLPLLSLLLGWQTLKTRKALDEFSGLLWFLRLIGFLCVLLTGCALIQIIFDQFTPQNLPALPQGYGGILGQIVGNGFLYAFNFIGATLFLSTLFLAGITFLTGLSWVRFSLLLGQGLQHISRKFIPALSPLLESIKQRIHRLREQRAERVKAAKIKQAEKALIQETLSKESLIKEAQRQATQAQDKAFKETPEIAPSNPARKYPTLGKRIQPTLSPVSTARPLTPPAVLNHVAPPPPQAPAKKPLANIASVASIAPNKPEKKIFKTPFFSRDKKNKNNEDNLPHLDLLDKPSGRYRAPSRESLEALSRTLELKLADFKIKAEVVAVLPGPVVTRFEIMPAPGVKVSQIIGLSKDLARSLTALSVRVVDVIPGKSVIGIEIPNEERDSVSLSEIIGSKVYAEPSSPLILALGKDIAGAATVMDLAKMPHMLVAGTTGSGKSVAINAMIISLLYRASPEQVRMIMIDPKMLELSIYDDIPHLLAPVVTDMKKAFNALNWCVQEMERRYKTMAHVGVRNLMGFNKKVNAAIQAGEPLANPLYTPIEGLEDDDDDEAFLAPYPYIVVIVDELADMMMIVGKKVEQSIARLAQKARAAGIHLILATQRPSVDVLTGLIKSNIPARIAFQVSSKIDSRTVLDQMGAESLLGLGDMLFLPPGTSVPQRVHGAFVDDHEVHNIVAALKATGKPQYIDAILNGSEFDENSPEGFEEDTEKDALYDEAVSFVTESRKASISAVQRRLKVGYNRAARMIEQMEISGVVSDMGNNGMREVLAPPPPKD